MNEGEEALDSDVVSSVISHSISFKAKELLPQIRVVDDKELLDYSFAGDVKALENYMEHGTGVREKRKIYTSIFDRYDNAMKWPFYQEGYNKEDKTALSNNGLLQPSKPFFTNNLSNAAPLETFKRAGKKVGRNDSCPCGSGKKYKKCCLRK